MTQEQHRARAQGGQKGNIIIAARAALRAERLALLIEQGLPLKQACYHAGISERTSRRYRERWA